MIVTNKLSHLLLRMTASLVLITLVASTSLAESNSSRTDEFGFYLGEDLPSGIDGVTEILPVFGGRYGMQVQRIGVFELGLSNTHAKGVDFTTVDVDFRATAPLANGVDGLFYAGLNGSYYTPQNQTNRQTALGLQIGAGAMMQVTDNLWLRGDLKFVGGPGSSLYLLFGIIFR